jgi:5'-3' exonuclease
MGIILEPASGTMLLIDMSYYVFYRYFATYNWYRRQADGDIDVEDIMNNAVFMDKYAKMFEKTIIDLVKSNKVSSMSNFVFVKDCSRDNIWRHQHFDAYKANRDEKTTTFNKNVFTYTYNELMPQLQAKLGFQMIGHHSLEADDVIAIITNDILDNYHNGNIKMVIITNDNDYIQLMNHVRLCDSEHSLLIKNLQDKNICLRVNCSPIQYINIKKIMGDKSDNIPSIMKKCGEKTAFKLATSQTALQELFDKDPAAKAQYELNDLLVDFSNIPQCFVEEIKTKVLIVNS